MVRSGTYPDPINLTTVKSLSTQCPSLPWVSGVRISLGGPFYLKKQGIKSNPSSFQPSYAHSSSLWSPCISRCTALAQTHAIPVLEVVTKPKKETHAGLGFA